MGPDQIFPGSNLVPDDIEPWCVWLSANGQTHLALASRPSLRFQSLTKYDELRGKPMSQISAKALDYIVNAFSDPRVGKRKLDVFQLLDQFVLPLVWNVTTDEMLLRQQAATAMPILSTRTISEAARVHLEAFSEDELNTSFWAAGK